MADRIATACDYARRRLEEDLPDWLTYHTLAHTEQVVLPAAQALATASGVDDASRQLLVVAVWFHDVGFTVRYERNEPVAVDMVRRVLPDLGFSEAEVETIEGLIWATQLPQRPMTPLEELMVDADLDALGRPDFWVIQEALREEFEANGRAVDAATWIDDQIAFLSSHRYFSAAARDRNDAAKARHLRELQAERDRLRRGR